MYLKVSCICIYDTFCAMYLYQYLRYIGKISYPALATSVVLSDHVFYIYLNSKIKHYKYNTALHLMTDSFMLIAHILF